MVPWEGRRKQAWFRAMVLQSVFMYWRLVGTWDRNYPPYLYYVFGWCT